MSKLVLMSLRKEAYKWIAVPLILIGVIGVFLITFQSVTIGYGFLLGGLIWAIATFYLAYRLFANMSPRAARQIVMAFYWGELVKLLLSGVLFVLVVKYLPVPALSVFWGYVIAQAMFWLVPMFSVIRVK